MGYGQLSKYMDTKSVSRVALVGLVAWGLGACSVFTNQKNPPDEFAVLTKAPLVIPPDYALRPPKSGQSSPAALQAQQRAEQSVFGRRDVDPELLEGQSAGEQALLNRAGAIDADPQIREVLGEEVAALSSGDTSLTDRILFWQDNPTGISVVDADDEAERLRKNEEEGRPATDGDTPVIDEDSGGFLGGIF